MTEKNNSIKKTSLPQRTNQHRIDTLAMRFVRTSLPDCWLDRDFSERDYGIDLAVEIFDQDDNSIDSETSTGLLSLIQVKGTAIPLEELGGYYKFPGFPVKTLNYAMQFKIPFFLIVVSINDGSISDSTAHFLWIQDYIRKNGFGLLRKGWNARKSMTLYIPKDNDFVRKQNHFKDCVLKDHSEVNRMDIIRKYSLVKDYTLRLEKVDVGNVMDMWVNLLETIEKYCSSEPYGLDVGKIKNFCKTVKISRTISSTMKEQLQKYLKCVQRTIFMINDLSELDYVSPTEDLQG